MTPIDHAFFLFAAFAYPLFSFFSFRKLLARIAAGDRIERKTLYNSTMLGLWLLFAGAIGTWALGGRTWATLGFSLQIDGMFLASVGLLVAGVVFLVLQIREVGGMNADDLAEFRRSVGDLDILLPRNGNELNRFYVVSLTAGVVEEVVWRGFFIWYLSQFLPLWTAALVSAIGFGVAHAYQGWSHVPKIVLVGAAFVLLFLMSGSLWLPMTFHALVDICQGRVAYEVVSRTDMGDPKPGSGAAAASA